MQVYKLLNFVIVLLTITELRNIIELWILNSVIPCRDTDIILQISVIVKYFFQESDRMYKCLDCEKEFKYPKRAAERHKLKGFPLEKIWLCPHCESNLFEKQPEYYCKNCGAKLSARGDYCSLSCRKKGEAAYKRQAELKEQLEHNPLILAIREVEAHNKATGKKISYGKYFGGER